MLPADKTAPNASELIEDYRYPDKKKKNIPLAGQPVKSKVKEQPKIRYEYDPHLPPVLRFDSAGAATNADRLPELLEEAQRRALNADEIRILSDALRNREPWLEWAGKREAKAVEVDPIALHIHERISTQAILKVAARQDVTRSLFADPEQEYRDAVDYYKHDVAWTNRLILGDSLEVMASLAKREDLAGKVQCIYMDPPYGIKYGSNFQSEVGKRDVKDRPEDLTREPEMVKAYRDTWNLGVHSYLAYLRDRLYTAKDLLADSGSIFVQISDENVHRVRMVMDEVFGSNNCCGEIVFAKTSGLTSGLLADRFDFLLWYAKDIKLVKYHRLYFDKSFEAGTATNYGWLELASGMRRGMNRNEKDNPIAIGDEAAVYKPDNITSQGNPIDPFIHNGKIYAKPWKTNAEGRRRLASANRLHVASDSLQYVRYLTDFACVPVTKLWEDTATGSFTDEKVYVVQTGTKTIERCLLMTTEPGDLVLDPTCGSGTSAYVAEQLGRRWITIDSSRVALAIARQRLMTAKYDYYPLRDHDKGVSGGFVYKTVPHITLKSIAQNTALDPLFEKWDKILAEKLHHLNLALVEVTPELRRDQKMKLELKRKQKDRSNPVTDADVRRWTLPGGGGGSARTNPSRLAVGRSGKFRSTPTQIGRKRYAMR